MKYLIRNYRLLQMETTYPSNRLLYNRAIIRKLTDLIEQNPYIRFGQLLQNCDINYEAQSEQSCLEDTFYEESEQTWLRMLDNKVCFPKRD